MTYVYLDLETTGLDPKTDLILECGLAIVDDELEVIDQRAYLFPLSNYVQAKLDRADEIVQTMHIGNHLIAEMAKLQVLGNTMSYNFYRGCLEADVLNWFEIVGLEPNTIEMSGDGIHYDRMFLREHMPRLEAFFHYRNWDSSIMKRMIKRWAPEYYRRHQLVFERKSSHRALPDVIQSIEETRLARNCVVISEGLWPKDSRANL